MANTVFENKVIEAKAKDLLTTAVNTRNLMTVDNSLSAAPGTTKTVNTYTYSGTAEEVAVGKGNTNRGSISYTPNNYVVKTVQQTFDYFDEDYMKDPTIVDNMLKGATQVMANKMTADFLAEMAKATLEQKFTTAYGYEPIVDAISQLNVEDESGIYNLIPNTWKAQLRKDPDYKSARMGEVIYNGQVGTVCGIPVIASKAPTEAYAATKEAVTLFMKKEVEVEQHRDIELRKNTVVLRTYYVCALTDATKVCKINKGTA
jgi:hypothetical protein